eukprot:301647-Rhodomonas_salina.1
MEEGMRELQSREWGRAVHAPPTRFSKKLVLPWSEIMSIHSKGFETRNCTGEEEERTRRKGPGGRRRRSGEEDRKTINQ